MAKKKTSTKKDVWKEDFSKSHKLKGSSDKDKRANYVHSQGGNEWDVAGFDRYMDYRTARSDMYGESNKEATKEWTSSHEKNLEKQREKEKKEEKARQEAFKKAEQERKQKRLAEQKKKHDDSFLTDVKNFFTGKDTDGDGQRNGLLGAIDRYVLPISVGATEFLAPGNNERMIQNDIDKHGKITNPVNKASIVDRGKETKALNTVGTLMAALTPYNKAYKAADYAFNKVPKLANAVTNPYAQKAIKGAFAGGTAEAGISAVNELVNPDANNMKDYALRTGLGVAGGAILDPALYGVGQGIRKGTEKYASNVMKDLLPKNNQVANTFANNLKNTHTEQLLPVSGGKPLSPNLLDNLIPKSNDFTNPNFVPNLIPKSKPILTVPKVGTNLDDALLNPRTDIPEPSLNISQPKVNTSQIDNEISELTRQLEQVKNQPKPKTITEINDALRSLDINDAYLRSSKQKGKITNDEYYRKLQENESKREALVNENKVYSHDIPDDLKVNWNNEFKSYVLGDYSAKKAYGGGYSVKKGNDVVQKFRTEEEAKRFMQESVAKEQGNNLSFDRDGVLNFKSSYDDVSKNWNIEAGDYSIVRGGKDNWIVKNKDQTVGTYKNEKKAREEAQRHFDSQPKPNEQATALQQRINELNQQREGLVNPPKIEAEQPQVKSQSEPIQETTQRPENLPPVEGERKHYNTIANSDKISPELLERIKQTDKTYTPMSNKELVDFANEFVSRDMEQAYQFVKNAGKRDPRHVAVAHRLIDELQKAGNFDRALDVVETIAEHGTKSGQNVQAFSLYNRLSPEGQLLRAQRRVNKVNETITNPEKQVKLSEQNIQDITHAADSIQKMTGQQEQTNNVIKIMDSIKNGKTATDSELEIVRSFVTDAKKFIGDLEVKPQKVKPVKDVRVRDKVVEHMTSAEEAARQRILARKNRANSLPADIFYDYTIIGASKIAKGTVKFADFSEQMIKDFGDEIKPYMQQVYNKAVETFNKQSESMTAKRLSEVEKITNKSLKDKNLSEDEAEVIREFARRIGQMSGDTKLESSMELQSILQTLERPTFGQKIATAQTIAQLLNPKTIGRNAIGNELFYRVEQINKFLATPVDIARSKLFGKERTITFRTNNQGEYWKNFFSGAKAGWKGVNPLGLTTAYDLQPLVFRSKWNPMTYFQKTLGATLRSFDNAGYMRAYNKTLGEMATLRAINEGLKGDAKKQAIQQYIRETDQNMINIADHYGKYVTFQDNTTFSNLLTKAKHGLNYLSTRAVTGGLAPTKDFGLGDLIIKYPKTPGNLIMRALEYSPAGVIRGASLLKEAISTKNPLTTRESTLAFTRSIVGTGGFSILGYALADLGILTSRGDSDYEVATLKRNAGLQPNSVNVSALKRFVGSGFNTKEAKLQEGDTFYSYDWAQPISMAIALGVGSNQAIKQNENPSTLDVAKSAANSAADTIVNMSVLSGLNNFLTGYQGEGWTEKLEGVTKGAVGSFVPTAINQVRQLSDNKARTTYSPTFSGENLSRAKNRLPYLEKSLPPAYDTLGNERETFQNGSNNPLNVLLNPSFVSKYQPTPEEKFILDYINETGDKTVAPYLAKKKLDGEKLTAEQYAELQRIMGLETQKGFKEVIPDLKGETDYEKVNKILRKVLRDAGKTARGQITKMK